MANIMNTTQDTAVLRTKTIGELNYKFRVPTYQRGYRWEREHIFQLLDDIADSKADVPYYLQPIVVAPCKDDRYDFDLIDGQQRLSSIYLVLKCFEKAAKPLSFKQVSELVNEGKITDEEGQRAMFVAGNLAKFEYSVPYTIGYQTRKSTEVFIKTIDTLTEDADRDLITESPDHLYMWHAFKAIDEWLHKEETTSSRIENVAKLIKTNVKIIWYELPESITDWKKFTDLNIGKIPLTNSELIKAVLLRSSNFSSNPDSEEYDKQTFVAQWDQIERELSDKDFWGFLTTDDPKHYPTRIDLLFDLITDTVLADKKDHLHTFNEFVKRYESQKSKTGKAVWDEIFQQYQRLRDWYADREIYHKLGYLIAIDFSGNKRTLLRIFRFANPHGPAKESNARVKRFLERLVKCSLRIPSGGKFENVKSFRDLKYNAAEDTSASPDPSHQYLIKRYLTIYNIALTESVNASLRYSFSNHNTVDGGWSLEHIHAQKSDVLNKQSQWTDWIQKHKVSLECLERSQSVNDEIKSMIKTLREEMSNFDKSTSRESFDKIANDFKAIMESLPGNKGLYQDEMSNMALLGKNANSTLNNSTFDVKRRKIIEMSGTNFVPLGTERIFLKAIVGSDCGGNHYQCDTEQLFFWGQTDRYAYMNDMEVKLKNFFNHG